MLPVLVGVNQSWWQVHCISVIATERPTFSVIPLATPTTQSLHFETWVRLHYYLHSLTKNQPYMFDLPEEQHLLPATLKSNWGSQGFVLRSETWRLFAKKAKYIHAELCYKSYYSARKSNLRTLLLFRFRTRHFPANSVQEQLVVWEVPLWVVLV